jgi:PAS domain S-box-containing protein
VGVLGLFVSFGLTWLVASLFIRPIREIVREAQEIAQGKRESRLHGRPNDEIGVLTHSLNMMLDALKERQKQIQEYARTLEHRVEERTSDLVDSEEKYRTLVENLPLVVYRILPDGTTEFVNSYFTEKLGYRAEEVGRDRDFWLEKICGSRRSEEGDVLRACWKQGEPYRMERVVKDKEGRLHTFIDHAIPFKDAQGRVKWVDGNMVEITELKRLQEMAIREEEIKTLGQISARFAHELRNPLTTAGGFARRLHDSLPEGDPGRKSAAIIVEQVARLESILRIILSSIEPFTLCVSKVDLNHLLRSLTGDLHRQFEKKGIQIKETLSPDLPMIQGDEMLLNKAFENLLRNAMIGMPEGEELILSTLREDDHVVATISHLLPFLAEEDLDQFFFPRFNGMAGAALPELPLSKIIVHRHGGKVDVMRNSGSRIVLRIELPSEL